MSSSRWRSSLSYGMVLVVLWGAPGHARHGELPNRIPEAAPYNVTEAESYPPPYEDKWTTINNPTLCAGCHMRILQDRNATMRANYLRDPRWRGACFLHS